MSVKESVQNVLEEIVDDIYDRRLDHEYVNGIIEVTFLCHQNTWSTTINDQVYNNLSTDDITQIKAYAAEDVSNVDSDNVSLIDVNNTEKYLSILVNEAYNEDDWGQDFFG